MQLWVLIKKVCMSFVKKTKGQETMIYSKLALWHIDWLSGGFKEGEQFYRIVL